MMEKTCKNCRHLLAANHERNYCCERSSIVPLNHTCCRWITLEIAASRENQRRKKGESK
jgi:hypothetical protein